MAKRIWIVLLSLIVLLSGCFMPSDPVLDSLGEPVESGFWTSGGFQDFTDYAKYRYSNVTSEELEQNSYFSPVSEEDLSKLQMVVEDFEEWVERSDKEELVEHYDFSVEMISVGDYFYLDDHGYYDPEDENYLSFFEYDLYYFAIETQTLYFFLYYY